MIDYDYYHMNICLPKEVMKNALLREMEDLKEKINDLKDDHELLDKFVMVHIINEKLEQLLEQD